MPRKISRLVTTDIWKHLASSAKKSRKPAFVAVAYFGQGASKLLPLGANSRLVVDASDNAVKSGQTCPAELGLLQKKGVIIYSVPNLHAKVYVFDRVAFVASANVSANSAKKLIEAMVCITDGSVIGAAKMFVRSLCSNELGPGTIDRLQKIYRPPRIAGLLVAGQRRKQSSQAALPRLFVTQLVRGDAPTGSEDAEEKGRRIAKAQRKHGRSYVLQDFNWSGIEPFRKGDKVIQVVKEEDGIRFVDAPGDVVHTHSWRRGNRRVMFVYLELPNVRRIRLENLARRLGYGAKKKLLKNGLVRNMDFAEDLLGNWQVA